MKKAISFILFCFFLLDIASAKPVDIATARRVAVNFMQAEGYEQAEKLVDITVHTTFREFYIFAAEDGGFVLVAADDCVIPILGYSTSSRFDARDIPVHVQEWLDDYESGIKYCREHEGDNIEPEWNMFLNGEIPSIMLETAVGPLLTTTWNQSPYYNEMCPYDNAYNRRAVAGCVAIAMAQIMKYWNHPTSGYGNHSYTSDYGTLSADFNTTYAWSSMPNVLNSSSSTTQVNAVAKLVYHVGVAVDMAYTANSSGAKAFNFCGNLIPSSETALMQYFKYRPDMTYIDKANYSDVQWSNMLRAELDQSRPILYTGHDSSGAGHAFVCDGYNNNGQFHFNWGWGGYCDGYYTIGALNPSSGGTGGNSTHTYNLWNRALLGIQPNTNWSGTGSTTISVSVSGGSSDCTVSGAGSYSNGNMVSLGATAASGCTFTGWSDGCKCNPRQLYANGGSYSFTALFSGSGGGTHYTITTYSNNSSKGIVVGGGSYAPGSSVTLTACPKSGYRFDHWQDGNKTNPRTIVVNSNLTYTANFVSGTCDTLAYCGNSPFLQSYGSLYYSVKERGIKFTPSQLEYRNYLKAVSAYISSSGIQILRVYQGGENTPGTLVHTQYVRYEYPEYNKWNTIVLDRRLQIDKTQNLWITIEARGWLARASAPYCQYSGDPNSNWVTVDGEAWQSLQDINHGGQYSWMIKAVTTSTAPTPGAPTVIIDYETSVRMIRAAIGTPVPFTAVGTSGATVSWSFENGTPATATGWSATSTWNSMSFMPHVIACISNQYGSSGDTLRLLLQDCSEPQNATTFGGGSFSDDDLLPCWTLLDEDGDGFGWTKGNNCITSYSRINYYGALTPDNWLITPLVHIPSDGHYYLSWYEGSGSSDNYGVYISTSGNNPSDFTLLHNYHPVSSQYARYMDLSNYCGRDVYIAFRHHNVSDISMISLDMIDISEGQLYHLSVTSNNDARGSVTGGGDYPMNKRVEITATPNTGYHFVRWQDGDTQNPRTVTVTGNASYVAYFERGSNGIEEPDNGIYCQLYPNPTKETATLVLGAANKMVHISLVDVYGHVLKTDEVSCSNGCTHQLDVRYLAKGIYFVRINMDSHVIVRKLIVE